MDIILSKPKTMSANQQRLAALSALAIAAIALVYAVYTYLPGGQDWSASYRPAALALLSGHSPYTIPGFFNAPWLLIPLIPMAILPEKLGFAILFAAGMALFAAVAHRLGAKPIAMIALLFSYPVLANLFYGQVDALVLSGLLLPPQFGLFLVLAKPQIGIGIAVFWFIEAFHEGGIARVVKVFAPVVIAFLLSFAIFGLWPLRFDSRIGIEWNLSFWPQSLVIGGVLLVAALRRRKLGLSMIASPFLSPYVAAYSWHTALFGLLPAQAETVAGVILVWALRFMTSDTLK